MHFKHQSTIHELRFKITIIYIETLIQHQWYYNFGPVPFTFHCSCNILTVTYDIKHMIKPRPSRVFRHQTKSFLNYHYLGLWFVKTNSITNIWMMTFRLIDTPYNLSFEYRLLTVEIWIYIFTSLLIEFRKILERG